MVYFDLTVQKKMELVLGVAKAVLKLTELSLVHVPHTGMRMKNPHFAQFLLFRILKYQ